MDKKPAVTTIGQLMDALKGGKAKNVSIPSKSGSSLARRFAEGQPGRTGPTLEQFSEYKDFDGLMRRLNKHYGQRLSDEVLLKAVAAVAEHTYLVIHNVRQMKFAEFNDALDEAMGVLRYGPDPRKPILYWDRQPHNVTHKNWELLKVIWGRHNVPFEEIGEKVWGDDTTPKGTIEQLIHRVNKQLSKHEIDLQFTVHGEKVSPLPGWPK